jgi:hypothetical protein
MQTIGDRIWYRAFKAIAERIAEREGELGFTGSYLDAGHISGVSSSSFLHTITNHVAATLGNIVYAGAAGAWTLLTGNITTTRKFLRQTGTGAVSAAPAWDTLVDGDIPTTLAGKTLTTATLTAPTIADFTNAQHDHGDADDGGALASGSTVSHDHTTAAGSGGILTAAEFDSYLEGAEIADPSAPAANKGRLYFRDNGSGKTQLVCVFPTGAVQILATEP